MRFSLAAVAVTLSGVLALPGRDIGLGRGGDHGITIELDLNIGNHYGAPHAPWESGSRPGWYYGDKPGKNDKYPCLRPVSPC